MLLIFSLFAFALSGSVYGAIEIPLVGDVVSLVEGVTKKELEFLIEVVPLVKHVTRMLEKPLLTTLNEITDGTKATETIDGVLSSIEGLCELKSECQELVTVTAEVCKSLQNDLGKLKTIKKNFQTKLDNILKDAKISIKKIYDTEKKCPGHKEIELPLVGDLTKLLGKINPLAGILGGDLLGSLLGSGGGGKGGLGGLIGGLTGKGGLVSGLLGGLLPSLLQLLGPLLGIVTGVGGRATGLLNPLVGAATVALSGILGPAAGILGGGGFGCGPFPNYPSPYGYPSFYPVCPQFYDPCGC